MVFLLEPPSPSRYDLCLTLVGVPIRVHPLFWILAVFVGGFTPDPVRLLIWVAAVFVSILIHELGHALAMRRFGQPSRIVLHLMGGLTVRLGALRGAGTE
jgi:stage IV sporulation protein FB